MVGINKMNEYRQDDFNKYEARQVTEETLEERMMVARELALYFNDPPKEVREDIKKVRRWINRGLPKAYSADVLGSACNW